jgi:hypothetical protein
MDRADGGRTLTHRRTATLDRHPPIEWLGISSITINRATTEERPDICEENDDARLD